MPQKIILVRHGETEDNKARRFQGWKDTPLNIAGHEQAKKVAERLRGEHIDALYTSDLSRTVETAEHIARALSIPAQKVHALREHDMGIFTGWQWEVERDAEKEKLWAEREKAWQANDLNWSDGLGESLREHLHRVSDFLEKIEADHQGHTIVLVSHGGTMNRVMEHYRLKTNMTTYTPYKNTAVTILESHAGAYRITIDNDTSHLTESIVLQSNDQ